MTEADQVSADPDGQLTASGYPVPLRALISVMAVIALAILGLSLHGAVTGPHDLKLTWAAGAVAAVLMGDLRLVEIRLGHNGNQFTWGEAALILGVTLVGWNWIIPLGAATLATRQVLAARPWPKTVFNASAFCIGAALAHLAFWGVTGDWADPSSHIDGMTVVAWAAAAAAFSVWVSSAVSLAIALSQRRRFRDVFERGARIKVVTFLGNSAAGLTTVALGGGNRSTVVILPFFFLLLYFAYNNFLRAQQEGQTWRQLHAATLSLKRIDSRAVLQAVRVGGENLFGSELTEVILEIDGTMAGHRVPGLLAMGLAAHGVTDVHLKSAPPVVAQELRALGLHSVTLAPLESVGRQLGILVIGFRGPIKLRRRERTVFATFADQTSISLQHARLFEELSAERGRLDAIVQHASDGILLVDGSGRVCSWNPALTLITGRNQQQALGMPLGDALNAMTENGLPLDGTQLIHDVYEAEQLRLPVVLTTSDGRTREVALAVSPVPDADGTGQFAVVVARDVTAQREVEQAKQDFIDTVSHELRTPLTPIKGYLTLLLRPDFMPDQAKRDGLLSMMLEQTGQLERLVDDLLSVSRMQHGEFNI
ncbi:MAG: hypothetical protein QOE76_2305, partial [Frankiales bacterium]|nr:hypothetical protein [Frankiales bacterium]